MSDFKLFVCVQCGFEYDEAKGWPEPKIVMRAWIFTSLMALIGVIAGILGMGK